MKLRPQLFICCVQLIVAGLASQQLLGSTSETWSYKSGMLINEVCFYPKPGEPAWVEINNRGEKPLDFSEYVLSLGLKSEFIFSKDLEQIPPGGFVLIIFDGQRHLIADDSSFKDDKLVVFHTDPDLSTDPNAYRNTSDFLFPREAGICSLYGSSNFSYDTILDFVCWGGNDPNKLPILTADSDAVRASAVSIK